MDEHWKSDLEAWLSPFLDALRHKVRARMYPAYVVGLLESRAVLNVEAERSGVRGRLMAGYM